MHKHIMTRMSSVVSESEFKSEEPEFDPLAGQGTRNLSVPPSLVQTCLYLTPTPPPHPPLYVRHAPTFVRMSKIPYPSVVKEYASQPVVWSHTTTAYAS